MVETHLAFALTRADQVANPYFYAPVSVPAGVTRIGVALETVLNGNPAPYDTDTDARPLRRALSNPVYCA
jgi:hypothetical protein